MRLNSGASYYCERFFKDTFSHLCYLILSGNKNYATARTRPPLSTIPKVTVLTWHDFFLHAKRGN
jgi:hypothetical protein